MLRDNALNGAVVGKREDLQYLSGYTGSDAVLVFSVRRKRCWLMTDQRYTEEAMRSAPGFEVVVWRGNFAESVGALCKKNNLNAVGHSPASMTVSFFTALENKGKKGTRWADIDPILSELRAVKSQSEVAAVKKALACAESAFATARKRWKIGMTEKEVKDDLEWEMRRHGAVDAAFETIVAVGPNASLPHAHAGERKLAAGKMLLVDFGARVGFYNSDLTRTLWPEHAPKVWLTRYRAVLEAQLAAIAMIAPGVAENEPDATARKILTRRNLNQYFTHGLGHGVGLAIHEAPRLGMRAANKLVAGNITTVEPGIYFPGSGGIRIEDMILVTDQGGEVLSSLPKDADSIIL